MPIPVECGSCGASYNLADAMAGKRVRCRECEKTIRVPSDEDEGDDAPEPEVRRPAKRKKKRQQASALPWIIVGLLVGTAVIVGGTMLAIGLANQGGAVGQPAAFQPKGNAPQFVPQGAQPKAQPNPVDDGTAIARAYPEGEMKISLGGVQKGTGFNNLNIPYTVTVPEEPDPFANSRPKGFPAPRRPLNIGSISVVVRVNGRMEESFLAGIVWNREGSIEIRSFGGLNAGLPSGTPLFLIDGAKKRISNIVNVP